MTDQVHVSNLCLHGFHGVHPEEKKLGQKFFVDIDCTVDIAPCAEADDYTKAVCYGALCDLAAEVSDSGQFNLVETLTVRIAEAVLERFPAVTSVTVRVRKPSAPLRVVFDHVGVSVTRQRRYSIGLSLGSNLGDKQANIRTALTLLNAEDNLEIDRVSRFYRTAPWGNTDQDWFLNVCATGWTARPPLSLLKCFKRTEVQVGRVPGERWGPRAIDIDLLYAGDVQMQTPHLTLPHPELFNRAFVLVPLAEIAGDHMVSGRRIGEEAARLSLAPDEIVPL